MKRSKNVYQIKKRWISAILTLTLLIGMSAGTAECYAAGGKPSFLSKTFVVFCEDNKLDPAHIGTKNISASAKEVSVSDSKKSVCESGAFDENSGYGMDGVLCIPKKAGTDKITYKVKQNGKTYTLKTTVKVKKPAAKNLPFSYIKVDGESVYGKADYNSSIFYTDSNSAVVSYKLKKGWKLKSMYTHTHYGYDEKYAEEIEENDKLNPDDIDRDRLNGKRTADKKVSNGKKINLQRNLEYWDTTEVYIDVTNKSGEMCHYVIRFVDDEVEVDD